MSKPTTAAEYIASLPADRKKAIQAIRKVIKANIDKPFREGIQYGMLGYFVPHSVYPAGYHCDPKQPLPFASIASQKNHIGLYLFCVYIDPPTQKWFVDAWKKSGKKLDMGKSCVRVKSVDDIPLDVLGALFKRLKAKAYIAAYDKSYGAAKKKAAAKKKVAKKAAKKATNKVAKRVARKKSAKKAARAKGRR